MTSTASFHQKNTDPDGWIISSTQMIKTSPFLWNASSKIIFFTLCWRLLRSVRLIRFLRSGKLLLKTSVIKILEFSLILMFWKKPFRYNHEISGWILAIFLLFLFWKLVEETQMSKHHKASRNPNLSKSLILLPLRGIFRFPPFHYETPCRKLLQYWLPQDIKVD